MEGNSFVPQTSSGIPFPATKQVHNVCCSVNTYTLKVVLLGGGVRVISVLCSFHDTKKTSLLTALMGMMWEGGQLLLTVTSVQVPTFQVTATVG